MGSTTWSGAPSPWAGPAASGRSRQAARRSPGGSPGRWPDSSGFVGRPQAAPLVLRPLTIVGVIRTNWLRSPAAQGARAHLDGPPARGSSSHLARDTHDHHAPAHPLDRVALVDLEGHDRVTGAGCRGGCRRPYGRRSCRRPRRSSPARWPAGHGRCRPPGRASDCAAAAGTRLGRSSSGAEARAVRGLPITQAWLADGGAVRALGPVRAGREPKRLTSAQSSCRRVAKIAAWVRRSRPSLASRLET